MKPEDVPEGSSWWVVDDTLVVADMPGLGTVSFNGKVSLPFPPDRLGRADHSRKCLSREEALIRIAELALEQIDREIAAAQASSPPADSVQQVGLRALRDARSNALAEWGLRTLQARTVSGEHPEAERGR